MIQRIQTLYLLAVVILGTVLIWLPVVLFVSPEGADTFEEYTLNAICMGSDIGEPTDIILPGLWGLQLTTVLIPLLALVDIFLFKKRLLQARLNIFSTLRCLGYYGVLALYIWQITLTYNVEWHLLPFASVPLVCMILTIMATRRILKDEALVRAADRIR